VKRKRIAEIFPICNSVVPVFLEKPAVFLSNSLKIRFLPLFYLNFEK